MCGIAGYFGNQKIDPVRIQTCLSLMHRRGPDNATYRHWTNRAGNNVYLLHSRLNIIDLDERANQPFRFWIIYNGELHEFLYRYIVVQLP